MDFVGESSAALEALLAQLRAASRAGAELRLRIVSRGRSPFEDPARTAAALAPRGTVHRVRGDGLELRSKPGEAAEGNVIGVLPQGCLVVKRGTARDPSWIRVAALVDGRKRIGYVLGSSLEAVPGRAVPAALARTKRRKRKAKAPAEPLALYRVTASRLNLRRSPKDLGDDAVLASLPRGQLVAKTGTVRGRLWWEVETVLHGTMLRGFVHRGFLTPLFGPLPADPPDPLDTALSVGPAAPGELELTDRALALILEFEGMSQPARWPGEMSGITLGHGYDLGYCTHDEFYGDWGPHLPETWMERLAEALGRRGAAARRMAPRFADIEIPRSAADAVFLQRTIPTQKARTAAAFPGVQALPPECQGALLSLVYNRGTSMQGARRREMREIRDCVADRTLPLTQKLETIAASIESMKRLWPSSRGLRRRRDAEAALVRMAA